jgi:hypothetical protein
MSPLLQNASPNAFVSNTCEIKAQRMNKLILPFISVLSLITYAGPANAELSAVEREKLHLCPRGCTPYCEEIPAKPIYCTCFCQSPGPTTDPTKGMNHRPKRPHR